MAQPGQGSTDDRVTGVLRPVVEATGHVLEAVSSTPAGKRRVVRVVVDLPDDRTGSMDLDAVSRVATVVSEALDASDVLGGTPYVLEVTTPGVDRPLTERRHWARARGRLVAVEVDGTAVTGRVGEVTGEGVVLVVGDEPRTAAWDSLGTGRVQVEFTRNGASQAPDGETDDDTDDTDEDEEV